MGASVGRTKSGAETPIPITVSQAASFYNVHLGLDQRRLHRQSNSPVFFSTALCGRTCFDLDTSAKQANNCGRTDSRASLLSGRLLRDGISELAPPCSPPDDARLGSSPTLLCRLPILSLASIPDTRAPCGSRAHVYVSFRRAGAQSRPLRRGHGGWRSAGCSDRHHWQPSIQALCARLLHCRGHKEQATILAVPEVRLAKLS